MSVMGMMYYACILSFIPVCITYNDKTFFQETLPEAICYCLQTCLF